MDLLPVELFHREIFSYLNYFEQLAFTLTCKIFRKPKLRQTHLDKYGKCVLCVRRIRVQAKPMACGRSTMLACGCYAHHRCFEWLECRPEDHARCVRLIGRGKKGVWSTS